MAIVNRNAVLFHRELEFANNRPTSRFNAQNAGHFKYIVADRMPCIHSVSGHHIGQSVTFDHQIVFVRIVIVHSNAGSSDAGHTFDDQGSDLTLQNPHFGRNRCTYDHDGVGDHFDMIGWNFTIFENKQLNQVYVNFKLRTETKKFGLEKFGLEQFGKKKKQKYDQP